MMNSLKQVDGGKQQNESQLNDDNTKQLKQQRQNNNEAASQLEDSVQSNCEHEDMIFNEDYLNTEQIQIFKAYMAAAPPRNQTTNINSDEGVGGGGGTGQINQFCKKEIFNTELVLSRYNTLSTLIELRQNPLLSNKGKLHYPVFQDLQQPYEGAESSSNNESSCSQQQQSESSESEQEEGVNGNSENLDLVPNGGVNGGRISRRDKPTRDQIVNGPNNINNQNMVSKYPDLNDGQQSEQQGIECDQQVRSGLRSILSKGGKSPRISNRYKNVDQINPNNIEDKRSRNNQSKFKEDDNDNDDDFEDDFSDRGNRIMKLKQLHGTPGNVGGSGSAGQVGSSDIQSQDIGSLENVRLQGGRVNGVKDKGGMSRQEDIKEPLSKVKIGSGAVQNMLGTKKKGGKKDKIERQLSLQKSGSKDKMIKSKKPAEKSKFRPNANAQPNKDKFPVPNIDASHSPSGLNLNMGSKIISNIIGVNVLNNKTKQAISNTLNAMNNPFMKPAFHLAVPQPQDTNVGIRAQNASEDNLQKNDKFKKLNQNQDLQNYSKPNLIAEPAKKAIRVAHSHSSNNSGHDSNNDFRQNHDYQSQRSYNSSNGALKSCFRSEGRRSSRKFMMSRGNLDSQRVKFHESIGKYSEEEESNKHYSNRNKYKKFPQQNKNDPNKDGNTPQQQPDVKIMINMRRFVKEVNIKATDPLVAQPYNKFYLIDQVEKKKYLQDVDICKYYVHTQKRGMLLNPKTVTTMQTQFARKEKNAQNPINFKDISQLKNAIKTSVKKTIVFDMDNTIMTTMYKKNEIQEYDAATYVKLFGHSALKIYLNYRPYLKEMLSELKKNDFELILFSYHNAKYLQEVAATLQKDEAYFDYLINKDHLYFDRDLDLHILDLNILLGAGRDLKDIIVISNSTCRHLVQYSNGVPVKEYTGSKRDLSLFALTKYLKSFKEVKDVRAKIAEDFSIN